MTEEEFKKYLENFWHWTSLQPRPQSNWLLSLEIWAKREFDTAFDKEKADAHEEQGNVV